MRHQWTNPDGLQYSSNDAKSICEKCGLIRLRLSRLRNQESTVYYHPNRPQTPTFKAPECE